VFIAHLSDPVSAVRHCHRFEGPADRRAIEFLVALGIPASSAHSSRNARATIRVAFSTPVTKRRDTFQLLERSIPAVLVAVARVFVEELFVRKRHQRAVAVRRRT
jgi:hypothetical protein